MHARAMSEGLRATLCARHYEAGGAVAAEAAGRALHLDGTRVPAPRFSPFHLCVESVGCGANGAARVLTVV